MVDLNKKNVPSFDEIVFEHRNKEYGAYQLRKKYNKNVNIALAIGVFIIFTVAFVPFLMASIKKVEKKEIKEVEARLEKIDEDAPPPPPPPPPPPEEQQVQQVKFTAPVIVDSVINKSNQLVAIDDIEEDIVDVNVEAATAETTEEKVEEAPKEIFIVVEEMPEFPGGNTLLQPYLNKNVKYPTSAIENGIQGRVFVKFCVNYKGHIEQVQILRGVDPLLDEEAIRVVKSMPTWKPGKQRGKPVNVWYNVPITFQLQQ